MARKFFRYMQVDQTGLSVSCSGTRNSMDFKVSGTLPVIADYDENGVMKSIKIIFIPDDDTTSE